MSWDTLTIERSLLDSMEGETLRKYNSSTDLGITDSDDERLSFAKRNVKMKLIEAGSHLIADGTYTSESLLDAFVGVDTDELLQTLLAYNFLYLLFQDAASTTSGRGKQKYEFYYMEFVKLIEIAPRILLSRLNPPRKGRNRRFVGVFG